MEQLTAELDQRLGDFVWKAPGYIHESAGKESCQLYYALSILPVCYISQKLLRSLTLPMQNDGPANR